MCVFACVKLQESTNGILQVVSCRTSLLLIMQLISEFSLLPAKGKITYLV